MRVTKSCPPYKNFVLQIQRIYLNYQRGGDTFLEFSLLVPKLALQLNDVAIRLLSMELNWNVILALEVDNLK